MLGAANVVQLLSHLAVARRTDLRWRGRRSNMSAVINRCFAWQGSRYRSGTSRRGGRRVTHWDWPDRAALGLCALHLMALCTKLEFHACHARGSRAHVFYSKGWAKMSCLGLAHTRELSRNPLHFRYSGVCTVKWMHRVCNPCTLANHG